MAAPFPETTLATPVPPPLPSLINTRRLRAQRLGRGLRLWVPAGILIAFPALVLALVTVLGNLLADLAYAVLDPRIRYGSSNS